MADDVGSVTVVIATRDRVGLLRRAIDSVWAQDFAGPIHVVVVFDGDVPGGPGGPDLPAGRTPSHTLQVEQNAQTPGAAGARNHALGLARTEFVAMLDDDDEWLPDKLSSQVRLAQEHPEASAIGGGLRVVTTRGDVTHRRVGARVELRDLLEKRVMELHTSTLLLRTDAMGEMSGFDETLPGGFAEDYDLLLRLTRDIGPILLVDQIVADVHWDTDSYYRSAWAAFAPALRLVLEKFPEFASCPRGRARLEAQIGFALASMGERGEARTWLRRAWRDNPREPRTILALLVLCRLLDGDRVQARLNARGRGI